MKPKLPVRSHRRASRNEKPHNPPFSEAVKVEVEGVSSGLIRIDMVAIDPAAAAKPKPSVPEARPTEPRSTPKHPARSDEPDPWERLTR